tara:strand:+ start:2002 stop:3309 length:1308 start_codon:yes stop_codon:yes gene_type:complete
MKIIKVKKGHNLKISGKPIHDILDTPEPSFITYHPARFKSFKTKLLVNVNDLVKVGTPLFFDKNNSEVMFTSSVSGNIKEIVYGNRRSVESIIIENDKKYDIFSIDINISRETLLNSGLWSLIRQKPFSKIPDSKSSPKSFFISSIPTEPFAVDNSFLFKNIDNDIQKGVDILKEIFNCDINMGVSDNSDFSELKNVNFFKVNKLHPSGNVGIQIHHIDPIKNADDTRWYLSMQDLNRIGYYFKQNKQFNYKYYSIGGNGVINPSYYKILIGTPIKKITEFSIKNIRYISGDVLSGNEISQDMSIDYYDEVLSIIQTSKKREFLGWLKPGLDKYSLTRTFLSKIVSNNKSILNTHLNGSVRTIISMGNWESVLPMDIYPEYLVKSILCKDIDMMEKLGIYESSPEDYALCSFICQSKVEVSKIIEDGLDLIMKEI